MSVQVIEDTVRVSQLKPSTTLQIDQTTVVVQNSETGPVTIVSNTTDVVTISATENINITTTPVINSVEVGVVGAQGIKGDKGDKGDTGNQGPQGTPGSGSAIQETPLGTINGSNIVFHLSQTPLTPATVNLELNGLGLLQGINYTLSGTQITLGLAPQFPDTLQAFYEV